MILFIHGVHKNLLFIFHIVNAMAGVLSISEILCKASLSTPEYVKSRKTWTLYNFAR